VGWHGLVRSRIRYPLLANAVQRLPTVWWDKTVRRQIVCSRRVPYGDAARWPNVAHNALAEDPGHTRPERHFPSGAAQTRIVSAARIRLDPRKSVRPFKGIICGDISEFESFMASHAVRRNTRAANVGRSEGRRSARLDKSRAVFDTQCDIRPRGGGQDQCCAGGRPRTSSRCCSGAIHIW
jgi:hypothetical protein